MLAIACALSTQAACSAPKPVAESKVDIRSADLQGSVDALCADEMGGRPTATSEELLAASYIAGAFESAGLAPAGDEGTYLHAFPFQVTTGAGSRTELRSQGRTFELGTEWQPLTAPASRSIAPSEVVLAGHGIVAPAQPPHAGRDEFEGIPLEGRWVVVLDGMPKDLAPAEALYLQRFAALEQKVQQARARRAAGLLLLVEAIDRPDGRPLFAGPPPMDDDIAVATLAVKAFHELLASTPSAAGALDGPAGANRSAILIPNLEIQAHIEVESEIRDGHNVIGVLHAAREHPTGPDRMPVVIGAHYDHLGMGGAGSGSQVREIAIHRGADDNASGVAALLAIARSLAAQRQAGTLAMRRDIVFAAWSGEERGRVGSRHFVERWKGEPFSAYVNLDMVGRLDGPLEIRGVATSSRWKSFVEPTLDAIRDAPEIDLQDRNGVFTDIETFEHACVPWLWIHTGDHLDWHTPRDLPEKLSYGGLERIARVVASLITAIAMDAAEIDFVPANPANPPACARPPRE